MARVLIVDDEKSIRNTVSEFLRLGGHEVQAAEDADAAGALMQAQVFDVVVTDIILPRVSGVTLLQRIKERTPDTQVIMMTGEPTVDTAVEAVRAGAYDYLAKPTSKRELLAVVGQAARVKALLDDKHQLETDNRRYQEDLERLVEERTEVLAARTRQLNAVREVAAEISREMNLKSVLDLITRRAMDLVVALSATVFLWDEQGQYLVPGAWHGYGEWRRTVRLRLGEGVAGSVAARRERLVLEDYPASPYALSSIVAQTDAMAVLAEPLLYRDQVVGVIVVDRARGEGCFRPEDVAVLALFANHAAIAIQNARLYQDVQQELAERKIAEEALATRTLQLEAIRAVAREIARELNLPTLLQLVTQRAGELLGGASGSCFLWDESGQCLTPIGWSGKPPPGEREPRHLGEGLVGAVAKRREAMFVNDYRTSRFALPAVVEHSDITAAVAVPLLYRERLLGVLALSDRGAPRRFSAQDQDLLTLFADHAAIAIENARLYQQIQEHAAELEGRVVARTTELAVANQGLRLASQHKSAFLANMSHELRTPLNSVLGFAQLLQEQTKDVFSAKQTRYLTNIYTSGQHLLALINDILDLSKVESGKITLTRVPLAVAEILEDLLVIARGLANKKQQTLHVEIAPGLPVLPADPVRFKQIFFNLVSNAVKFTPAGGSVRVTARRICDLQFPISDSPSTIPGPQSQIANQKSQIPPEPQLQIANPKSQIGDFLEIAVTDTGAGIRAADLPKLFREFTQLETTAAQAHEGTGLGLALTRRLVELHGGTVTAASPGEGLGSTFTVRLPFDGPTGKAEE
jgi:signal transduction histidine kinase/DNA-binding response OmpR family regulator